MRASLPAEDATQRLVYVEALYQSASGENAQDRLSHESSSENEAVLERPTRPPRRLRNERFETDHVERGDETAQRFGDRIVVLTQLLDCISKILMGSGEKNKLLAFSGFETPGSDRGP